MRTSPGAIFATAADVRALLDLVDVLAGALAKLRPAVMEAELLMVRTTELTADEAAVLRWVSER
jgi:hypothetical protein